MVNTIFWVVVLFFCTAPLVLGGTIYFYRDANGVLHFTDLPTSTKYKPFILGDTSLDKDSIKRILKRYCNIYNVDYALGLAILKAESNFDPHAVSQKGAMGLMQIMPGTQEELGVLSPFDPEESIEAGIRYLRKLLDKYRDVKLAIAAYNAGPSAVKKYKGIPPFKETQQYVNKVFTLYKNLKRKHQLINITQEE